MTQEGTLSIRQTRIFVPPVSPYDRNTWVESLLGRVVAPLVAERPSLPWFWFSHYVQPRDDSGDCDISQIPNSFAFDDGFFRSLRFRYAISTEERDRLEHRARQFIDASGSKISDFRDYDRVEDLGGDRFVGEERSNARRERRADLVATFLSALCRLTLDCLRGPDSEGGYRFEANDSRENPHESSFESLHHLFCNITDVPTFVLVVADHVGTHWIPPASTGSAYEVEVRF